MLHYSQGRILVEDAAKSSLQECNVPASLDAEGPKGQKQKIMLSIIFSIAYKMVAYERILISGFLVLLFTILFFIAMYHIYMFGAEGGFTNSISVRLLIAGTCFNAIVIAIVGYLMLQIRLLVRLVDRVQNGNNERPRPLKEKVLQSLRGRSSSIRTKTNDSKYTE